MYQLRIYTLRTAGLAGELLGDLQGWRRCRQRSSARPAQPLSELTR